MASVTAGKPAELAYLDRSVAGAEAALDALVDTVAASVNSVAASVLTRLGSIKSIQSISSQMNIGVASVNASISAVNLSKSIILMLGVSSAEFDGSTKVTAYLSSTSVVSLNRSATGYAATVRFMVVEFN